MNHAAAAKSTAFLAQAGVEILTPSGGRNTNSSYHVKFGPKDGPRIELTVMVARENLHNVVGVGRRGTLLLHRSEDGAITGDFTPGPGVKVTHILKILPLEDIEERSGRAYPLPGGTHAVVLFPIAK